MMCQHSSYCVCVTYTVATVQVSDTAACAHKRANSAHTNARTQCIKFIYAMYMHTGTQTSAAKAPDSKVGRISASSTHRRPLLKTGDSCANSVV